MVKVARAPTAPPIFSHPPWTARSPWPTPLVAPQPLLPLLPHPEGSAPPPPVRPALPPPPAGFVRSTHAAPAAYPKLLAEAHGPFSRASHPWRTAEPLADESKEERVQRQNGELAECVRQRYAARHWSIEEAKMAAPKGHWLAAERWKREKPVGGYTLVLTHANGLLKEHWQPVLRDLLSRDASSQGVKFGSGAPLSTPTSIAIDDIWMIDDNNHGASVDLNAGRLGGVQAWCDDSRDFLNFVAHVLPGIKAAEGRAEAAAGGARDGDGNAAPWHLPWTASGSGMDTKVIGLGHSFGGNGLVQAAHARPDLFHALFLIDPMVPPQVVPEHDGLAHNAREFPLTAVTVRRRDTWPSRGEARRIMGSSPFMRVWDPAMVDLWASHALVPVDPADPDGPVTLATPAWCEAAVFTEPSDVGRGWDKFGALPIPVGTLMANYPTATLGEPNTHEMVWRPRLARTERVLDAGHLVLQEKPKATADAIWRFITTLNAGEWGTSPAEIRKEWDALPREDFEIPKELCASLIPVRSLVPAAKL